MIDLTGKKFGRLTALHCTRLVRYGKTCHAMWQVRCDCGVEKEVRGPSLRSGLTKSCGCLRKETSSINAKTVNSLPIGEATRRAVLGVYRKAARDRSLEWELSDQAFYMLLGENCHYCGDAPSNHRRSRSGNGDFIYSGIDRRNNLQGYTIDNVVSCCSICNDMKGTMSAENFISHLRRVVSRQSL